MTKNNMLTTREAAEMIGMSRRSILSMIQLGRLAATKIGRDWAIKPKDLLKIKKEKSNGSD